MLISILGFIKAYFVGLCVIYGKECNEGFFKCRMQFRKIFFLHYIIIIVFTTICDGYENQVCMSFVIPGSGAITQSRMDHRASKGMVI